MSFLIEYGYQLSENPLNKYAITNAFVLSRLQERKRLVIFTNLYEALIVLGIDEPKVYYLRMN